VRFSGEDGLGELASELQGRVRPELRRRDVSGAIHLFGVDRDFSGEAQIPPDTWMLAFGWHMHPLFDLRYDFPYHPNLRPLYLSFHVNRLDMLSEAALEELRRHGPVGCRDWTTVFLLLSAGVDAFFSGCVSLTVDALVPDARRGVPRRGAGRADRRPAACGGRREAGPLVQHQADAYAIMPLADGLRAATPRCTATSASWIAR
jgi:hypothetical protein